MSDRKVIVTQLGLMPYAEALAVQEQTLAFVADGAPAQVLLVEHPSVITLGRHAALSNVLISDEERARRHIDLYATERGGEPTCHNPGQLVVYPILPLGRWGLGVRAYVTLLEQAVINTLAEFGVVGQRDPEYPGVWVGAEKICAVGIRIKQRVSMHGIALNIRNDLAFFQTIIPCGITDRRVTSLSRIGVEVALDKVSGVFCAHLQALLAAT